MVFAGDICLIGFLALHAYRDGDTSYIFADSIADGYTADTLDRYEVPFLGRLASSFVDEE